MKDIASRDGVKDRKGNTEERDAGQRERERESE